MWLRARAWARFDWQNDWGVDQVSDCASVITLVESSVITLLGFQSDGCDAKASHDPADPQLSHVVEAEAEEMCIYTGTAQRFPARTN